MTFDPAPRPPAEHLNGAATAHMLITGAASNGHCADHIEAKHDEVPGLFAPDAGQALAEREWLSGSQAEDVGAVAILRDLERACAADRAAMDAPRGRGRWADVEAEAG